MPETTQDVSSADIFGIAKKMHLELEKLPQESHQVICGMLAQMFQRRVIHEEGKLVRDKEARQAAREQREAEQHEMMMKRMEKQQADAAGKELVGAGLAGLVTGPQSVAGVGR